MSGARKAFSIDSNMAQEPFYASEPASPAGLVEGRVSAADESAGWAATSGWTSPASGNSSTWAVPPAASILAVALLVNASATTKSGLVTSPWPRILSGLLSVRMSPAAARMSGVIVTGAGLADFLADFADAEELGAPSTSGISR